MTTAVFATTYGGPEALELREVDLPAPEAEQVTVEVRAAGINQFDLKVYSGLVGDDPDKLPMRLGSEAAGVVTAVGSDARGPAGPIAVGDEVIAYSINGGYAQAVTVPASSVFPKPPALSWEQAAGLSLTGVTAYHLLEATRVQSGDTVLVHAASGGVGLVAAQLAVERGATVIGTASPARHDQLRELGVAPVAYGDGLEERVREAAPDGVDAALDAVGSDEAVDVSLAVVGDRDRIATIAAFARAGEAGIKLLGNGPGADPGSEIRSRARLVLTDLAQQGRLRVFVARAFPLAEVADAHRFVGQRHPGGKVVLVP